MIIYRSIQKKIFLLVTVLSLGIQSVEGQIPIDYAGKFKAEQLEKQKAEKEAYETACKKGSIEALKAFVRNYPKSKYVPEVNSRIKELEQGIANNANDSARKTGSIDALNESSEEISRAKKKEHELKAVQYYNSGDLDDAYREFLYAGGEDSISSSNREAYEKCEEYHEFSLLNSYSKEADLHAFLNKYPNSQYAPQISNRIAVAKAKGFTMYTGDYAYQAALSYAKDDATRSRVMSIYKAKKEEYSQYMELQREIERRENGGIVNFGIQIADFGLNPIAYTDDNSMDYVMYFNMGLGIKFGNFKSPVQFEVGIQPGFALYTEWFGYIDETNISFHMPIYARLKIGLGGGDSFKCFIDGIGYYNAIKDSSLESDISLSAGFGLAWRHWDWRIVYYKQDIATKHIYSDPKFLGTSVSYFF